MTVNGGLPLICKMVKTMMPAVCRELGRWRRLAERIPDEALRAQALASMERKSFHCMGGGVYALYPHSNFMGSIRFIVAFQTISDYLDNLCDRAGVLDASAFRQLHLSMLDAIDPGGAKHDYYSLYTHRDDGGYLDALVEECRAHIRALPSDPAIKSRIKQLVSWYNELQSLKHMEPALREERLKRWAGPLAAAYPGVSPWEFCAATGSTLGVFLLFAAAQAPGFTAEQADALIRAYFPWVCGLHILLDYFIDAEEDEGEGDFNFTSYYQDEAECGERLAHIAGKAHAACSELKYPGFHTTIVRGLLALYLSDPKANTQRNLGTAMHILKSGGVRAALYCRICRALRKRGKL